MKNGKNVIVACLAVFLAVMCIFEFVLFNIQLKSEKETVLRLSSPLENSHLDIVNFDDANSRDTYFTVHNVAEAQKISKGKGVKVGIMDHSFAMEKHKGLYAGGKDFTGNPDLLSKEEWHGYWMASVLHEIAPECEIYALCTFSTDEGTKVRNMANAIDWAIENGIDILTYSAEAFSDSNRAIIDAAVNKAVDKGITTTFIHYDNPKNLWPTGISPLRFERMSRDPDLNIFHYDYNTLFIKDYVAYSKATDEQRQQLMPPYMSISSTSPVTAGFVAMLKSVNNTLKPEEYKEILIKTSDSKEYYDSFAKQTIQCERLVDIKKALDYMEDNY